MITGITKRFTFALILCLGIMQLLLPFLHVHYNGNQSHEDMGAQLLHMHTVQLDSHAGHVQLDVDTEAHTHLVDRSLDSAVVNIDHAILSQKLIDAMSFVAILVATESARCSLFCTVTTSSGFCLMSLKKNPQWMFLIP